MVSKSDLKLINIVEISSQEAIIKFRAKSALFIDARDPDDYQISHVKGAVNILVDDEDLSYTDKKFNRAELNSNKEFVIYCGGVTCGLSKELANKFIEMGYGAHIYIIKNGFPEWEKNNYPIGETE
jgi:rhodanese-related sulfurtransferase